MTSFVNKVILIGRLTADPERRLAGQVPVVNFTIATNESWRDKSGQKQERTEFHKVVVWGRLADSCAQFLRKGSQVYLEGKLQTRNYQDKQGQQKYVTEVSGQEVKFLDPRERAA